MDDFVDRCERYSEVVDATDYGHSGHHDIVYKAIFLT
jgi:hypothetical protein